MGASVGSRGPWRLRRPKPAPGPRGTKVAIDEGYVAHSGHLVTQGVPMLKIFALTMALSMSSCPGAIGKALRLWGYTEVRPASTFWEPGTLVYVKHWQPFEVGIICDAKEVLGEDFKPRESLTMNADMSRISKKGVTLDVEVADIVNSNNAINNVSDLKMTLNNGHIFEITDLDVARRRSRIDPHCLEELKRRQESGYKITMISSALRADVVYNVTWDKSSKMSLAAKVQALANLSASLGAEANPQTINKINGNGLYWGVRDDVYLAQTLLQSATAAPVQPDSRIIPTDLVISGVKVDAPKPGDASGPTASDPNGGGRKVLSWQSDEGTITYEMEARSPAKRYTLSPADPNEAWEGRVLEPIHEVRSGQ